MKGRRVQRKRRQGHFNLVSLLPGGYCVTRRGKKDRGGLYYRAMVTKCLSKGEQWGAARRGGGGGKVRKKNSAALKEGS